MKLIELGGIVRVDHEVPKQPVRRSTDFSRDRIGQTTQDAGRVGPSGLTRLIGGRAPAYLAK